MQLVGWAMPTIFVCEFWAGGGQSPPYEWENNAVFSLPQAGQFELQNFSADVVAAELEEDH